MKKLAIILGVFCLLTLCSCSSQETNIDVDKTAAKLAQDITFKDTLTELSDEQAMSIYGLDEKTVANCAVYVSSGATAEEIAVWQGKDSDGVAAIKKAITSRIDAQIEGYSDYMPTEVPKLETPVLVTTGNYLALCISDDNEKAKEILKALSFAM
ncbi:MAG: DUF4358 domain-containing protein [Clostridiales bacterium]